MTKPFLIVLTPDKCNQAMRYYQLMVKLSRCYGSCYTLDNPSGRIYVVSKTEDINLNASNIVTRINESKSFTKLISCESKCKFDGRKCNSDQK